MTKVNITRETSWDPDRRNWLFSWSVLASAPPLPSPHPHSPVLIKISAHKSPLNQVPFIFFFFHQSSKHFVINTNALFMKKQLIWVFESCRLSFASECQELTCMLDPLWHRWGVPPVAIRCVHWTLQRGVLQTWITPQSPTIVMHQSNWTQKRHPISHPTAEVCSVYRKYFG